MMDAVKLAIAGAALLLVAAGAVVGGILPPDDLAGIAERVAPILAFVVAVTIVAELAAKAGVFDVAAGWLARASRGRTTLLWLLVVALAVVATAFLSLDTTAVLLTPVVVAVARANGLPPLPFAFTTVWLANTASLVLPVSNLTNLLALGRLPEGGPVAFLALMGPSAAVAIAVTVSLLFAIHRRSLVGRFDPAPVPRVTDRVQLGVASVVVVALMPALVSGLEPWIPATIAAVLLIGLFAWRSPRGLSLRLIPWQLLVFAAGLFTAMAALESLGSAAVVSVIAGEAGGPFELWRMAGTALVAANTVDNLPAYLLLESAAGTPERLGALLVGVNAGPLITPWASLATLLWHERLHAVGVDVPWRRFVLWGLVAAPLVVGLSVLPLALR
ncbi:arsenic transporter [Microbacterium arborescens]|jgi:arsenical pump membrane protein|uniref:Arsenic transporter n=1 Tax=Microbacterium arborescens TaxID=33883 RepID=A0ABX2WH09_9MICO|nr:MULTISPECIES: SLC13 family permease [Microbacterium]OAZ39872.1 arsenic transporter [Microbacterium arborescens]QCR40142.1 arsenic transporter [Microbacterium sp. SGAir0570]